MASLKNPAIAGDLQFDTFIYGDPQFFADHKGKRLRFSQDGVKFHDTGIKLPAPTAPAAASKSKGKAAKGKTVRLPLQADVLK
jgi:hypothetical protein